MIEHNAVIAAAYSEVAVRHSDRVLALDDRRLCACGYAHNILDDYLARGINAGASVTGTLNGGVCDRHISAASVGRYRSAMCAAGGDVNVVGINDALIGRIDTSGGVACGGYLNIGDIGSSVSRREHRISARTI